MEDVEASGRTVDEAIDIALAEMEMTRDQVKVEVLDKGRQRLLGIGGVEARVRVRPLAEGEEPDEIVEDEAAPAVAERPPLAEGEEDEAEKAAQILDKLLELMGVEAEVSIRDPETAGDGAGMAEAVLDVEGDDLGVLIGRRGDTLHSLQYVLNLIVHRQVGDHVMFTVDVEGYRRRRERQLQQMAQRMAEQVRRTHRPVTMEPMPASERRIIHLTLANDRYVTTASIGEGENRQVNIEPKR